MTEVTRVPLQPIAKGSLTKLWLGVIIAILIGAGVAWAAAPHVKTLAGGTTVETLKQGEGPSPTKADIALVNYKGELTNGKVFDQSQNAPLQVDGVVPGFSEALQVMQKGGKYRVRIPADQGYGADEKSNPQTGEVVIPANSDLVFEVELVDFRSQQEIMRMMQQQQMMQQMQQGGAGGPGGPNPSAPQ